MKELGSFQDKVQQRARDIVSVEFAKRLGKNPHYSLRSFSRDSSISPSALSEFLSGKRRLTLKRLEKLFSDLSLDDKAFELIVSATVSHQGTKAKLSLINKRPDLSIEKFRVISDWEHFAILAYLQCQEREQSPIAIAKAFELSISRVNLALNRLIKIGLLQEKKGKWILTNESLHVGDGVSDNSIKRAHVLDLDLIRHAILGLDIKKRDAFSLTLAMRQDQLPLIRKRIRKFFQKLEQELNAEKATGVYKMNFYTYPLSKEEK